MASSFSGQQWIEFLSGGKSSQRFHPAHDALSVCFMTVYSDVWKEEMYERAEKELENVVVEEHILKVLCSSRNSKIAEDPAELWGHSCPSAELSFVPSNHPAMPVWWQRLMSSCPIGLSAPWGGFSPWNRLGAGGWKSTHAQTHCCWWALLTRGSSGFNPRNLKTFHGNFWLRAS